MNMSGTALITAAFAKASQDQHLIHERWITASFRIGGKLPTSNLVVSVQSIGQLDLLIRMMEDETGLSHAEDGGIATAFALTYQRIFSELWVGSAYEIGRLLRQRNLAPDCDKFRSLFRDLELLRMPIEKHEIASDTKLNSSLTMRKMPSQPDDVDYLYDPKDPMRAHIMPMGLSPRRSVMWHVLEVRDHSERWLEMRALSDRFLEVFAPSRA